MKINPNRGLYIKLGDKGRFERDCILNDQVIRLQYELIPHDMCLRGEWNAVTAEVLKVYSTDPGAASNHTRQIQEFYTAGEDVVWVTFFGDRLWWCFAGPALTRLSDGTTVRPVIGSWSSTDIDGAPLSKNRLSGRLLSMQGFRGTICKVTEISYLVHKINGDVLPRIEEARTTLAELQEQIEALLSTFHWKDFEILVDLIFRAAGWQRVGELGGTTKTLDLDLISPVTEERYGVSVKSSATRKVFEDFQRQFEDMQGFARVFFVAHTPDRGLRDLAANYSSSDSDVAIWLPSTVAGLVVKYGPAEWVIDRAS